MPHTFHTVNNSCGDDTQNGEIPIGAVLPAMQNTDCKHGTPNCSHMPSYRLPDVAANAVHYSSDLLTLCEDDTSDPLAVLSMDLEHLATRGRYEHVDP